MVRPLLLAPYRVAQGSRRSDRTLADFHGARHFIAAAKLVLRLGIEVSGEDIALDELSFWRPLALNLPFLRFPPALSKY